MKSSHADARELFISVHFVSARVNGPLPTITLRIRSQCPREQRSRQQDLTFSSNWPHRLNPAQTTAPTSAQEIQQDSLSLIVHRVRRQDYVCGNGPGWLLEKFIARAPRGLFQVIAGL